MTDYKQKQARIEHANALIQAIASHGRKFFRSSTGEVANFEVDRNGAVYYRDDYTRAFIKMGSRNRWTGFSHGGTLKDLVQRMHAYIETGKPLARDLIGLDRTFGSGNIWGYAPDALDACRREAYALPIIEQVEGAAA